jgi:ATP-binding cassette subfamily B protein
MVIQGVLPLAWLMVVKLIVDRLTGAAGNLTPEENFEGLAVLLGVAFGVSVVTALCAAISGYASTALGHLVTDSVQQLVQRKSVSLDLEYYENALAYDKLYRAQREAPSRPTQIVLQLAQLGQSFLTLAALLVLLATFHWGVVAVLLFASLPLVAYRLKFSQALYDWRRSVTLTERRAKYLNDLVSTPQSAKELRLFGFEAVMRERYATIRAELRKALLGLTGERHRKEFVFHTVAALAGYSTMAYVAYRAVYGEVSIGDLVMYFGAFQIALTSLRAVLSGIGTLYEHNLFLSSLDEFLQVPKNVLEPRQPRSIPRPFRDAIRVEGVTFRYPGTDRLVLDDLNMTIGLGQTVALVGSNGSGKSTLIKLLCRLYDPTEGRITIDGIDIREFSPNALRREISVIFQDYVHYHMSARENIWLGRCDVPPDDSLIVAAAKQAGLDENLQRLKDGYDTVLSRSLADGAELSIGQWQKLSLARSLYRDAQFIILDEPTSSMDAGAEYEFFETFRALAKERTAIIVSHRFSTVRGADQIYVIDGGRVTENGTHDDLVALGGLYAKLYGQQASHYRA